MTKIHAHRGASAERPENTMAAFRRAKEMGAYGIEMDVHLLNDGTLAVHHDTDLGRCDNATGRITSFDYNTIRSSERNFPLNTKKKGFPISPNCWNSFRKILFF